MKRFFASVFLTLLMFACGPIPQEEAQSNVGITAPDGFSIACYTGFTRTTPHFCADTTSSAAIYTATLDNTCRNFDLTISVPVVPTSSKFVYGQAAFVINSNNAIAIRNVIMTFYWDNTCTTAFGSAKQSIREFAAVAAGTELSNPNFQMMVPVVAQKIYYKGTTTGGVNSLFSFIPFGYYD